MKRQRSKSMSLADTNSGFLIIPLKTNKHFLVALKKGQIIHQIGFLNILPIFGLVNIDGFTLPLKKTQQILTSDWMPARCISAGNFDIKISSKSLQKILKEIEGVQTSTIDATFNGIGESQIGSVFIAECYEPTLIEWMVEAEDCVVHTADTESTASNKNSKQWRTATELVVGKGLLATKEVLDFLKIDLFEIKPTWRTALGGLLGTLRLQSVNETDMKVVICGAKGSGKSSVVRCTVNRFLSVSSQVCVIDCDVGQPEFSVPGLVSLYVISEPILAPCHLNLRTPELSVFVGDVTPKNSPYMIEQAVKALYERYLTLSNAKKDEYKKQNGKPSSSSSSSSTKNIFDALTDDTDTHSASNRHKYLLPLVVNIDGYTRYMGAEILSSILSTVQPTHICHICTEKDMELPPVEQYLAAKGSSKSSSCELYKLEPGSMSPGKVSATDLRTLRLVSYFLRTSNFMRGRVGDMVMAEDALSVARSAVTTSFSSSSSSSSSSPPEIYGPYSTFPVALAPIMKRCFSIRNGSIFDRDGWLAQALAHAPAVVAPLSTVDLCIPSTDIIPQLFPAAFTSSLVSLSRYPSLVSDEKASLSAVSTILLRDPSISKNIAPCRVNITREWVCLEHSELAIVRHIDIQSQTVILTLPCLGNNNDCSAVTSVKEPNIRPDRLAVIRAAFPLPIQLAYSPTFLTHAYITGDLVGEGSNVMKARKNMKRK